MHKSTYDPKVSELPRVLSFYLIVQKCQSHKYVLGLYNIILHIVIIILYTTQ